MSRDLKSYLKGVGSGYAKTLVTMLIGLWMVPFTLQFLTKAEYGVFAIAGDILLWLGLLQLGTGASLSSRAAQMLGRKDTEGLGELASTALVMQLGAALLVALIGGAIALNIGWVFPTAGEIAGLQTAFFLLVLGGSFQISAQVFSGLLIANKQIHIDNLLGIGLFLLQTAITICLLWMGYKLMALAIASLVSISIVSVLAYWRVKKWMPEIRLSFGRFRMNHVRDLFGNGVWFTVGGLAGILILNLDRFMVGHYVSLETVTAFVITGKLYFIADKIHGQAINVLRPYFGGLHGKKQIGELADLYHSTLCASILLASIMAFSIFMLNKWFIGFWVGHDQYISDMVSYLFAVNFVLQSSVLPNRALLASTLYKTKIHALSRVAEGLANLLLSLILVRNFKESGVLVASIISCIAFSTIIMNLISRNYFKSSNHDLKVNYFAAFMPAASLIFMLPGISDFDLIKFISPFVMLFSAALYIKNDRFARIGFSLAVSMMRKG